MPPSWSFFGGRGAHLCNSPPSLLMFGNNYLKQLAFGARANSPAPICRSTTLSLTVGMPSGRNLPTLPRQREIRKLRHAVFRRDGRNLRSRAELSERAMSLCPVPSGASQNDFGASVLASAIMTHLATGDLSVGNFEAYIRDFTFVWLIPL